MADKIILDTTEYNDSNGNIVLCGSDHVKIYLKEDGHNNKIRIGNITIGGDLDIYIRGNNNDVLIEDGCIFPSRALVMMHGGKLMISSGCSFGTGLLIMVHLCSNISIGKDCMSSYDLNLMAGDGHLIYDLETKEVINVEGITPNDYFSGSVEIGEHVWFGLGATIMGGVNKTVIGNGSIIGSKAVVKGSFPNNVIIAGVPGKVVRKNVAWGRHAYGIENIDEACNGYTQYTSEISPV